MRKRRNSEYTSIVGHHYAFFSSSRPVRLSAHRPEQLLRFGRAAAAPGVSQPAAGGGADAGGYDVLHCGELRGEGAWNQDRNAGGRGEEGLPGDRAGRGQSQSDYAEYSHKIAKAVERCCPVAHTPSIDEMVCQLIGREQEPPAGEEDCARDQAGDQGRCGRDAAVLDRNGAESVPGEDRERHAEAGWADRAAAFAVAAGRLRILSCGTCRG